MEGSESGCAWLIDIADVCKGGKDVGSGSPVAMLRLFSVVWDEDARFGYRGSILFCQYEDDVGGCRSACGCGSLCPI
jgi:hypothetical protein